MIEDGPTIREQFLYAVAQEFGPTDAIFTGFQWPTVAARVARSLHAPEFTAVYEAGIVHQGKTPMMPSSTTELEAFQENAVMFSNSLDSLHTFLKSGDLDGSVVEAPTVDRFGNVNSTVVGEYENPTIRLPGPGGANDILAYGQNVTLVNGSIESNRYKDSLSYISSPGHLDGDGTRVNNGYPDGSGPARLICPLGRFVFDDSGRAQLDALATSVTVDRVHDITGWDIDGSNVETWKLPDEDELAVIRREIAHAQERGYSAIRS